MIGVFDSGSGGLTVLRAIRDRFPSVDVLYFGDIARAPYGSRPREELSKFTVDSITFLLGRGATSIVSACNSVSASLAVSLFDTMALPSNRLIEMVGPTVRSFREMDARIALCATPATITSGIYQSAFAMIGKAPIFVSIEKLAGAIEFGAREDEIESIIRDAFPIIVQEQFDVLILACTHYPLVSNIFVRVLEGKTIFDPAIAVAERVEAQLWPLEAGEGRTTFTISKESEPFRGFVQRLFPSERYVIEVLE
jgi:glutamate racemase